MNKFKYIICIIFGILLFLLWNRINGFSIGNQYGLDFVGTPLTSSDPNNILLDLFNKVVNREEVCSRDFSECQRVMSRSGGECQINTIVGLYSTLDIEFSPDDQKYINSFGSSLKENLGDVYDYLTNREIMRALLVQNNLNPLRLLVTSHPSPDPQRPVINHAGASSLISLSVNKLYPTYVGRADKRDISTMINIRGYAESLDYGHDLLMYKTDLNGLRSFKDSIPMMGIGDQDLRTIILDNLKASVELLDSASPNIRENGIVCIMIDLCQKQFYAVTELDYPISVLFVENPLVNQAQVDEYNALWILKLNIKFLIQYEIVTLQSMLPALNEHNLNIANINDNSDDAMVLTNRDRWKDDVDFRTKFKFFTYIPDTQTYTQDFQVDTLELKPSESFYGKLNRLCKDDPNDRCDPDLYCNEGVERLGTQFDICVPSGSEGTPCVKSVQGEQLDRLDFHCVGPDLYCKHDVIQDDGETLDICSKFGAEDALCRTKYDINDRCDSVPFPAPNLYCLNMEDGSEHCIDITKIVLIVIPKRLSKANPVTLVVDPVNQSGSIYEYNFFYSQQYHLPSLDQLKQHMIYLGDFQKYSFKTFLGMGRWQKRSFFLEWNSVDGKFYLMYCIPNIDMSSSDNIVLDIKDKLPIRTQYTTHDSFFKLGKHDDTNRNYITIYFEDGTKRPYLELNTVSMSDQLTPSNNLNNILTHMNTLLVLEQQSKLKACAGGATMGGVGVGATMGGAGGIGGGK